MRSCRKTTTHAVAVLGMSVLALLSMASVSVAAPKPPPQPLQDTVTGTGTSGFCGGAFRVDVRSGPSGENPTGELACGTFFSGPVTCLSVSGNVALLTTQTSQFGAVAVRITDNGPSADRVEALPGIGCPTPLGSYADMSFTGDIVVVDAPPAPPTPTSKEQCKNGGWAQFGFKNQGQCVAFVQRGPQP
jgi:hypothetical protein